MVVFLLVLSCIIEYSVVWEEVVFFNIIVFIYFNYIFIFIFNLVDNFLFVFSFCMMNDIIFLFLVLCFCEDI